MARQLRELRGRIGLMVAVALGIASPMKRAAACGACVSFEHDVDLIPSGGEVPRNPRVFALLATPPGEVVWSLEADGSDVPVEVESAGGAANAYWISPKTTLEAGNVYRLGAEGVVTAGREVDETPPVLGSVSITSGGSAFGGLCSAARGATLSIESIVEEEAAHGGLVVQLDVTGASGTERLFARVQAFTIPQSVAFGTADDGVSLGARAMRDAVVGERYSATVTVFDNAGNSTSVDVPDFEFAATSPGGCGPTVGSPTLSENAGCSLVPKRTRSDGGIFLMALLAAAGLCGVRRGHGPAGRIA